MINPIDPKTEYWIQGRQNFFFGGTVEDCEYNPKFPQYHDWMMGFEEAEQASKGIDNEQLFSER